MSNILIASPQVIADPANLKLLFFRFDMKAVQTIVNDTKMDYKIHFRAATSVEMIFDTGVAFSAASTALLMHYGPLNNA